jgi:hypothetical protein
LPDKFKNLFHFWKFLQLMYICLQGISPLGQDVQEACSCTCLADVLQESRELPNQELYDATAVNLIDVTHLSL